VRHIENKGNVPTPTHGLVGLIIRLVGVIRCPYTTTLSVTGILSLNVPVKSLVVRRRAVELFTSLKVCRDKESSWIIAASPVIVVVSIVFRLVISTGTLLTKSGDANAWNAY
jgi:hypothetical protein